MRPQAPIAPRKKSPPLPEPASTQCPQPHQIRLTSRMWPSTPSAPRQSPPAHSAPTSAASEAALSGTPWVRHSSSSHSASRVRWAPTSVLISRLQLWWLGSTWEHMGAQRARELGHGWVLGVVLGRLARGRVGDAAGHATQACMPQKLLGRQLAGAPSLCSCPSPPVPAAAPLTPHTSSPTCPSAPADTSEASATPPLPLRLTRAHCIARNTSSARSQRPWTPSAPISPWYICTARRAGTAAIAAAQRASRAL